MGRKLQQNGDAYDADTLKLLARVFNAAWRDISNGEAASDAADRRIRLAEIILVIAREGARDEADMKRLAVHIMRTEQLVERNMVHS